MFDKKILQYFKNEFLNLVISTTRGCMVIYKDYGFDFGTVVIPK